MKNKLNISIFILLAAIVLGFSINTPDNNKPINLKKTKNYSKQWQSIDSLINKGLPKSAIKFVDKIYAEAKHDNNYNQIVKSFIYKLDLSTQYEEDAFEKNIYQLQNEIKTAKYPTKNLLHSILAQLYWQYYQNNKWKIMQRTQTVNFDNKDIKTWTLNAIVDKTIKEFNLSLQNSDSLKRTPILFFNDIITKGENTDNLQPTLYDFLANTALNFFKNSQITLTRPADKFELLDNSYFADATTFANFNIKTTDTLSLQFYGIKILQNLTKFRNQDTNLSALIDLEINRLNFVYKNSANKDKNNLYKNALKKLLKKYSYLPSSTEIYYVLAKFYRNNATKYNYKDSSSVKYKYYNSKAYNLCDKAIKQFPKTNIGVKKCINLIENIKSKYLNVNVETVIPSKSKFSVLVTYLNEDTIYYKIGKISPEQYQKIKYKLYGANFYDKISKNCNYVSNGSFSLPVDKDFNKHSTEYILNGLDYGFYLLFASDNKDFSINDKLTTISTFTISDISYARCSSNDQKIKFYVLNRKTGVPMPGVNVDFYKEKYSYVKRQYEYVKLDKKLSDKDGYVEIKNSNSYDNIKAKFTNGKDVLSPNNSFYSYSSREAEPKINDFIFTDRAIYRPGQTIYFKGISIKYNGDTRKIVPNSKVKVDFYDVNYQKISSLDLVTNEFGTFNGSFKIPLGLLNGQMRISTINGNKYIRVEEYKRPKFETKLLPFNKSYKINENVSVKGIATTYSGANLTDANVKYTITRSSYTRYYWLYPVNANTTVIKNGTTKTNDKGEYSIDFKAIPDLTQPNSSYFNYSISVDVTDINGETQSTSSNIYIGYTDLNISSNLSGDINKMDVDTFKIYSNNLNGENVDSKGTIKIYKLVTPTKATRSRYWATPDKFIYTKQQWDKIFPNNEYKKLNDYQLPIEKLVYSKDFDTKKSKSFRIKNLKDWETGKYRVIINSKDAFGTNVENKNNFVLYSPNEQKIPYADNLIFIPINTNVEPGDTAKILIASSNKVKVLVEINSRNSKQKKWININNNQYLLKIPVKEEYRGNFVVNGFYVFNNRKYNFSTTVNVPFSNKDLNIKFQTFRDKLLPGEKEKWLLTIKDKKGDPVLAEMLATMYDKSLDAYASNSFYLNIYPYYYNYYSWSFDLFNSNSSQLYNYSNKSFPFPQKTYNSLNWFGYYYRGYEQTYKVYYNDEVSSGGEYKDKFFSKHKTRAAAPRPLKKAEAEKKEEEGEHADIDDETTLLGVSDKPVTEEKSNAQTIDTQNLSQIKARTNFNETAFFYPNLKTNDKGELVIEFTAPESLTKWKIIGLATTKDLKIGTIQKELITQKKLMVMPNPPRFFREGDKIEFPLKISNISDKELSVEYDIKLFDAFTNKEILLDDFQKTTLDIPVGGNKSITAILTIPDNVNAIKYRVVASSGNYSDAEENIIPVLSNRMLVTESLPLPINGNQTKKFEFKKLINNKSKTLKNYKYTLEFTSNPAWYAVQALPYLMEYPYECSEQTFNRFYANSLATFIANSSPKIKAVFDSWKNTKNSKALLSNLEKNQELKALMLEETPWVMDGKNETERKARIALLFDLNKMSRELNIALRKLQKAQSANGGWPWFKGMPENRYITQYIVSGMGHLDHLKVKSIRQNSKTWNMVYKAVKYLDNRIYDDYNSLKKYYKKDELKKDHINSTQIQYLYARSFFNDIQINSKNREAYNYFLNQAKKYWLNKSIYSQGMIALVLNRSDEAKTGIPIEMDIVKSLKEKSLTNDEMGMYWKNNISGYLWYQAPIETQALMIEVFDEVADDKTSVENLKKWLLKQKQTQDWKTTKATSEAIYALLLRGNNLLTNDNLVEIKIANKKIDPKKIDGVNIEAGTGYFKTSWSGDEITPDMGKITITKNNDGIAWGAVYWQYFENLDKITKHKTPIHIEKKLFIEKKTKSGKIIEPIEKNKLQIGDKVIVRIEIRVDRKMEFVHMKDMRASGFEPINVISQYKYQDGLSYYETTKDASTNFFMDYLPKGTYVFEYPLRVTHKGDFSNGITTIQCMYAPEFTSHSNGIRVKVN